jgi:hypothetical protein
MAAGNYDIFIEQGSTFSIILNLKNESYSPLNLMNMTFRGHMKNSFSDVNPALQFSFRVANQADPATVGQVEVYLTAAQTAGISSPATGIVRTITSMVYDIESVQRISGVDVVTRWLQGVVSVSPEVTR